MGEQAITHMLPDGELQPLKGSSVHDNWSAKTEAERRAEFPPELIERKLRSLLNRLTTHNFPSISQQIIHWINSPIPQNDCQSLRKLLQLILQQLNDRGPRPRLCACLCLELIQLSNNLKYTIDGLSLSGGLLFRHLLDRACKEEIQKRVFCEQVEEIADDQALATAETDGQEDPHTQGEDVTVAERFYAAQKAKRQRLALVQFMGELFKVGMLAQTTLFELIGKLFSNINPTDEKFIECFCCLMMIVGRLLDKERILQIATYFSRIESMRSDPRVTLRARFMFQDLLEARQNNWEECGANNDMEPAVQPPITTPSNPPHTVPFDTKNDTVTKLKEKQKKFFLQCLLEQRRLGFQARDGSLEMQGWRNVAKRMDKQYNKNFEREWLTDQFDQLRNAYLDATAVLGLPGFKWQKHHVKADSPTWKRLFEANPDKRSDYEVLRQIQFKWYPTAEQLFKGTALTPVKLPAAHVKPQIKELELTGWDTHVQPPASTSPNQLQDSPTGALGYSNSMDHVEPGSRHDTCSIPTSDIWQVQESLSRPITTATLKKEKDVVIQLNKKQERYLLQSLLQQRRLGFQTDDGNFQTHVWARANPDKRDDYTSLQRKHRFKWYSLAEEVFKGTALPHRRVEFPADEKAQNKHLEPVGWEVDVRLAASTSAGQLEGNPSSAQGDCNPRELTQSVRHSDTSTVRRGVTVPGPEGTSCAITKAITVMARMFLNQVEPLEYVKFIQVVEKLENAVVFSALADTTNPTICKTWLLQKILQRL
ncbi:hypothetical protein VP01_26g15 [Puccinia sorghi]|uniref:MIF4G domain-containing protein n=1 Tax=Puccinia sorghi TaxID=27349 RepID=A0A0L6V3N5_9BASI|nr:hypothetical protein VP01_26g15 [Puccinia sorghi]